MDVCVRVILVLHFKTTKQHVEFNTTKEEREKGKRFNEPEGTL